MPNKYGPSITAILPNTNSNLCFANHAGDGKINYSPIIGWVVHVLQEDFDGDAEPCDCSAIPLGLGSNEIGGFGDIFVYDRSTGEWSQADGKFGNGEADFIKSYDAWEERRHNR